MGFSTALQGRAAHEALVVRQDAELRLMEVMKRALQLRVKCDKEYAINLASVAQQGLKIDRADEMQGSLITKSWRSYMDELDHQSKQFKTNAELLEVVCEKLTHLSQDKRKARKTYQEEHTKIAARLNHLTDEVVRKKAEYQKHLEGYKALRTRFEEHYIKSGRGGRKLDDVRDKYQKACRKLHLTHNEYVLSITEAVEVEKDFRNILLPGLLEHQQSVQESFILLWKNILQEASQHGDLTSDKFKEIQKRIDNVISSVNPNEEYREFTEKHRTSPTSPVVFQFDEALIGDIPGKLQSSTLAVDNLTVDWLRTRLLDLELSVKDCQEKQLKMIEHVDAGAPVTANGSLSSNGTNGMQSSKESQHRQCKDLNALRCQEKQKQKLVDMIKFALNEVGCEELPSGCDDHLTLDQNFIEDSFNNHQQNSNSTSVSIMNELKRRGGVLTLLRGRHFKRKSTPQPTTPMTACRTKRFNTKMKPRSQSLGSLSVICPNTPYRYEPIFTNVPLRMAASDEANNNQDFLHDLSELKEDMYSLKFVPSKLRRSLSHGSVCVQVDVVRVVAEMRDDNNTNSHSMAMNNNHIYAELDLKEEREVNEEKLNEMKQYINPTVERTSTAKKKEKEQIKKIKENMPNQKKINEQIKQKSFEEKSKTLAIVSEVMQNSIDAHLDKIDALNRALDNRLKCAASPHQETDLDAIEFAELQDVVARSSNDTNQTSNKRVSTSNSDKEIRISDAVSYNVIDNKTKKRSLSFSQKSINALLCNIKEFSKSPLTKIHRSHDSKDSFPGSPETSFANLQKSHNEIKSNTEVGEVNPQKLSTTLPPPENHSVFLNNAIEPLHKHLEQTCIVMSNPSKIDTNLITSKLKFKVPKIQKKSKALRQTFRSKFLHFQLKRDNLCRTCTKKRRIYPSKSVFDFAKEFNLDGKSEDNEEFCTCPRSYHSVPKITQNKTGVGDDTVDDDNSSDDVLSIKDHCYCVPSLSTSVSNGCLKNSASHYKLTCNAPQLNLLFTSSSNSFMCTLVVNRRHYSHSH